MSAPSLEQGAPSENVRCGDCGHMVHRTDAALCDGVMVCAECRVPCEHCEDITRTESMVHVHADGSQWSCALYCQHCADYVTWCCESCGSLFAEDVESHEHDDYDGALCRHCHRQACDRARNHVIGSYHNSERRAQTMPIPSEWTARHNGRSLGVELEVERRDDSTQDLHDIARALLEAGNGTGARQMFAEHDGSLNDGFELISQPMGLDGHRVLWSHVLNSSAVRELRSHDTTTCGLHVHVTRAGLSRLQIAKAVVFLNDPRNEQFIRAIARRYGNGYCKLKNVRMGGAASSHDRYEMLNLTSSRTVEFRLFRGTLRAGTVLACIEFAHALLEWAKDAACNAITWQSFVTWLYAPAQRADTVNLRMYLTRRVTERMAPRYVELRDLITTLTGKAPVAPTNETSAARWAEI